MAEVKHYSSDEIIYLAYCFFL